MFRTSRENRRQAQWRAAVAASALLWLGPHTLAQNDLTEPPRITEATQPLPPPAPPQANDPEAEVEEIVVISDQNPWRLPDLGSAWRAQQEEQQDTGRISVDLLPIWDPDAEEIPTRNPFAVTDSIRRVGFIEVFRVRFGGR